MKKIAIMQPYFLPYIGYFQLINAVDEFVVYDNIQFSKKGWYHRNRILENGKDVYITLPLKNDSDYLDVRDRVLADNFEKEKTKILSKIKNSYIKAPYFKSVFPLVEKILTFEEKNLFYFVYNSIVEINAFLNIKTPIVISSTIDIDHKLKASEKVIEIVKKRNANIYINPIRGIELYSKNEFRDNNIDLQFIKTDDFTYTQYGKEFVPFLSIIDVLMFNEINSMNQILNNFKII